MKAKLYHLWQESVIFYLGGMFYCGVELLWRGWTHGSMFLLGALCFYLVGGLNRRFQMPVLAQMLLGAVIVTFFEFWTGMLVKRVEYARLGLFRRADEFNGADLRAVYAALVPAERHCRFLRGRLAAPPLS